MGKERRARARLCAHLVEDFTGVRAVVADQVIECHRVHTRARGNPAHILQAMSLSIGRARSLQRSTIDSGLVLEAISSPRRTGVQQRLPFDIFAAQPGDTPPAPVVLFQERAGHGLEGG